MEGKNSFELAAQVVEEVSSVVIKPKAFNRNDDDWFIIRWALTC